MVFSGLRPRAFSRSSVGEKSGQLFDVIDEGREGG
jgi:hypothetical protein